MKKKPLTIVIILIGLLLAILIIYLGLTKNMTYEKLLDKLQSTTTITIIEQATAEQIASSKSSNLKITSKKQIQEIIDFIASGEESQEECWHNLPLPEYEVKFLDKNNKVLTKFDLNQEDDHLHLEGEGYSYKVDLNVEKLIQLFHKKS